jgi:signal transduction histidine kinase
MHLADFILRDMETILLEWDSFAGSCATRTAKMSPRALRDHARQILEAVAKDLRTAQSDEAQEQKSKGRAPVVLNAPETAAQTHAVLRARSGFDINQLVSEYRALRASVSSLWIDACYPNAPRIEDLVRFHEAIDQAVAESVEFFDDQIEKTRNLFLGMLGHDMRTPLQSIKMTAEYLIELRADAEISEVASVLLSSADSMQSLLDDLVDFGRTRLGLGISINCTNVDLGILFLEELEMLRRAYPDKMLELQLSGGLHGHWDGHRLQQLLRNLVVNAIKYGDKGKPVRVVIVGEDDELIFEVLNQGPVMEQSTLERIFEPLERATEQTNPSDGSLGLGLFIAREIATGHGGSIRARSNANETAFTVRLPRQAAALVAL